MSGSSPLAGEHELIWSFAEQCPDYIHIRPRLALSATTESHVLTNVQIALLMTVSSSQEATTFDRALVSKRSSR